MIRTKSGQNVKRIALGSYMPQHLRKIIQHSKPKKLRTKSVDEVQPTATKLPRGHHGKITCSQCREVMPNNSHNVATPSKQPEPHIGHDIPHHTRDFDGQPVAKFQSHMQPTWILSWWPIMSEDLANMGEDFLVSQIINPTPTEPTKDKPQTEKTLGLKTKQHANHASTSSTLKRFISFRPSRAPIRDDWKA
ncbi:hypothetical protein TorRG33x02_074830 [Trema orientale]|uniref:Uncharacterized protein n=1 Tax=Trema orientale TaxID=63057 RepID=A0A2P5FG60_TREOI|nr:hypothetical protein TorRG33x02_074830 [Trema orientale]